MKILLIILSALASFAGLEEDFEGKTYVFCEIVKRNCKAENLVDVKDGKLPSSDTSTSLDMRKRLNELVELHAEVINIKRQSDERLLQTYEGFALAYETFVTLVKETMKTSTEDVKAALKKYLEFIG